MHFCEYTKGGEGKGIFATEAKTVETSISHIQKILAKKLPSWKGGALSRFNYLYDGLGGESEGREGEFSNIFLQIRSSHQCMLLHAENSV